jgi:hypothetical protein
MKFDLLVRIVALILGLTAVCFSFWTFSEGRLGRFACVALAGMGLVLVVSVLGPFLHDVMVCEKKIYVLS